MIKKKFNLGRIPAVIWGEKSDKVYIFVHGKKVLKLLLKLLLAMAIRQSVSTYQNMAKDWMPDINVIL